jgi:hypothetical protein
MSRDAGPSVGIRMFGTADVGFSRCVLLLTTLLLARQKAEACPEELDTGLAALATIRKNEVFREGQDPR